MVSGIRPPLLIVTAFWVYLAVSNILYANSMQLSLSVFHVRDFFAPWTARLLQHAFLYPALLLCVWASVRLGWRPILRRLLPQALLAVGFATLAYPALGLGLWLVGDHPTGPPDPSIAGELASVGQELDHAQMHIWFATSNSFLLTYGFALALVSGFIVYRQLRDSQIRAAALERALGAAQLAALRMQLSPHSLFNLLHSIRGQIDWDPAAARTMVVQLGDLLRRLLNAGEREYSRLADEMQFVRLYLELQQRRFPDRLMLELPEPASLPAAWVPSLILQPLVENAVVHGLAGHGDPVLIRLQACVSDSELTLRIANTIARGRCAGGDGIGLKNVRERLAIQFGQSAAFSAAATDDRLWVAEIRVPLLAEAFERAAAGTRSA